VKRKALMEKHEYWQRFRKKKMAVVEEYIQAKRK
jgi:hypothetical protein